MTTKETFRDLLGDPPDFRRLTVLLALIEREISRGLQSNLAVARIQDAQTGASTALMLLATGWAAELIEGVLSYASQLEAGCPAQSGAAGGAAAPPVS